LRSVGYFGAFPSGLAREGKHQPDGSLEISRSLFSSGDSLDLSTVERSFSLDELDQLTKAGLLEQNGESVRSLFQIQVYDNVLFFADFMPRHHPTDLVLPIGPSGRYLAKATIRNPSANALDLGCGCGIQALLMARHVRHVTATDINPRAVELTRINAKLNGFQNIEVMDGSYFEPVQTKTFDLITANLPYVFTPDKHFIYRDLGEDGVELIKEMLQHTSKHLNEAGYACLLLNWPHSNEQPWREPIEAWLKNCNVDVWTLHSKSETPEAYTKTWKHDATQTDDKKSHNTDHWLKWFKEQQIDRIASGLVILRRRTSSSNWGCSIHVHDIANEPLGGQIQLLFQSQDFLGSIDNSSDLLGLKLMPYNMKIEKTPAGNLMARTTHGFLIKSEISLVTAAAIWELDGATTLQAVIQKSQRPSNSTVADEQIAKEIRLLMGLGMVKPIQD